MDSHGLFWSRKQVEVVLSLEPEIWYFHVVVVVVVVFVAARARSCCTWPPVLHDYFSLINQSQVMKLSSSKKSLPFICFSQIYAKEAICRPEETFRVGLGKFSFMNTQVIKIRWNLVTSVTLCVTNDICDVIVNKECFLWIRRVWTRQTK